MVLHFRKVYSYLRFRRRQHSSITTIPQDTAAVLFTCLSTPDQICLALTCKSFYNYYICSFLRTQGIEVDLSRLIPAKRREKRLYRNMDLQNEPWIQLLKQLENKCWKYCSECWRLHRLDAWRRPRDSHFLSDGEWVSQSKQWTESSCMPFAGTLDICPCLEITYPDKIRLIKQLDSVRKRDMTTRAYFHDKILYHPVTEFGPEFGPECIGHQCTLKGQHPLADVKIYTVINWDEDQDELRTRAQYTFSDSAHFKELLQSLNSSSKSSSPQVPQEIRTPHMCPHKKTRRWLRQFFKESKTGISDLSCFYTHVVPYNEKCDCGKKMGQFRSYDGLAIYVEQDMGGIKWLGKAGRRDLELLCSLISFR